jgi:hypothetical protein
LYGFIRVLDLVLPSIVLPGCRNRRCSSCCSSTSDVVAAGCSPDQEHDDANTYLVLGGVCFEIDGLGFRFQGSYGICVQVPAVVHGTCFGYPAPWKKFMGQDDSITSLVPVLDSSFVVPPKYV